MRHDFIVTGTPKVFVSSHGGTRVKLFLWPFCGWILGPTKAIWYPKCGQNELKILVSNWFNWRAQSQAEIGSEWDFAAEHIFM